MNSYLQSGMNDVLAKPFTKHGLFGILDKHLIHLKAIQLSNEVPRSLGLPPLSDQGVVDAVMTGAAQWVDPSGGGEIALRNPLSAMGWSDETYHVVIGVSIASPISVDRADPLSAIHADWRHARSHGDTERRDPYLGGLWRLVWLQSEAEHRRGGRGVDAFACESYAQGSEEAEGRVSQSDRAGSAL